MQPKNERPNKKAVNAAIQEISMLHKTLCGIVDAEASIKETIARQARELRQNAALDEAALIDIDVLNPDKEGIRISALKSHGITRISHVCKMTVHQHICGGIGNRRKKLEAVFGKRLDKRNS